MERKKVGQPARSNPRLALQYLQSSIQYLGVQLFRRGTVARAARVIRDREQRELF